MKHPIREVLVDAGAWYALADRRDQHHAAASRVFPRLVQSARLLVTTALIVAETYALLRTRLGYPEARRFLTTLDNSPRLQSIPLTPELEREGREWLERYQDHPFSYVDAISFAVMSARNVRHAFAFDVHFRTAGFIRIPVDAEP